jgi:hypothetical protein
MKVCPNKNTPEWKLLESKLGEAGAMRLFMLNESDPDALRVAADLLDINKYTIEDKVDRLMSVASKVDFNDSPDPVTGEPRHDYTIEDATAPNGRKKLQSVSQVLDQEESTKYRGDDAGNEYSKRGTDIHSVFNKIGKGESEQNILRFIQDKGIPNSFYYEAKSFMDSLAKRGKVLTEVTLSDMSSLSGSGDIVLLAYDGTVEVYDFKTAHETRRYQGKSKEKLWNPTADYGGYKGRRYPTQVEFYGKLIENTLGVPVSAKYLVPIEIRYNNFNPSEGFASITMLPAENANQYGYERKAQKIVDQYFGETTPEVRPSLINPDDSGTFLSLITGRIEDRVIDVDREAENIMANRTRTIRGLLHFKSDKGWVLFNNQTNRAIQKRQIIDEYLGKKESAKRDIVTSILNYLKDGKDPYLDTNERVPTMLRTVLAKYQGKGRSINVYELSDIEGFKNKTNWVVFQEGDNFDLLYVGNDQLNSKLALDKKQGIIDTLFRNYYTGQEARRVLHSDLKGTVVDAKKFEAGLITMKLKEGNPNAVFDRIMIYSLNEQSGDQPTAVNLTTVLPTIKNIVKDGRIPGIPASYASIFGKEESFNPKTYQQDFAQTYIEYMQAMNMEKDSKAVQAINNYEQHHLDKERLARAIMGEINSLRMTGKIDENQHQLYLLSQLYYQLREVPTDIRPVTFFERWGSMPTNVATTVIQDIYRQVKGAINRTREQFWDGYKKQFIETQKALFNQAGVLDYVQDYTISNTSRYYDNLVEQKTFKVRGENGEVIEKKLSAFSFKEEGSTAFNALTKPEQDFIRAANDAIMKAAANADVKWVRGRIPLTPATFMNKFFKATSGTSALNYQEAYTQALRSLFDSVEDNYGMGDAKKANDHDLFLRNLFQSQANTEEFEGKRPEMLGITQDGFIDPELHSQYETNLEVVVDLFMMNSIRVKEFNKVASVFNAAKTLFEMQKFYFQDEGLGRSISWIETWQQAMMNNTDVDSGTIQNKAVKVINKAASATIIGFKPITALVSYMSQEMAATSRAIANTLSRSDNFKLNHWVKAGTMIFNPKNNDKVNLLLEQYGMFDLDLNALINGRRRYGNRSVFKSKFLYGMLNSADWASRSQILVAQMLNDGTWDAYSVQNGELVYDESKDERFKSDTGKLIKNAIKQRLAVEGHLTGRDTDDMENRLMTRAYDDRLSGKLKFEADSIIGGFDRETRALYSYNALGKLMGLFKTWLPSKLNRGFDKPFESMVNGQYVIETDNTGVKTAVWRGKQMEGIVHSLLAGLWYVRNIKNKQNQVPLTEVQKQNLYQFATDFIIIGIAMLGWAGIPDDDRESQLDDESADLLRKSVQDLLSVYNMFQVAELLYTPVAIEFLDKSMRQVWSIAAGVGDPEKQTVDQILDTAPVTRHFEWLIEEMEED